MIKKIISVIVIITFIIYIPVSSYAGIVNQAQMIANAAGRAKAALYAKQLADAYKMSRLAIGFAGTGAGVVLAALTIYDLWNQYGDKIQAEIDLSTAYNANNIQSAEGQNQWGKQTAQFCNRTYYPEWKHHEGCAKYKSGYKYYEGNYSCGYDGSAYKMVGQKFGKVAENGVMVYGGCEDTNGVIEKAPVNQLKTYYALASSIDNANGTITGEQGETIPDYAETNTQAMLQTIADAVAVLQAALDEFASQMASMPSASGQPLEWGKDALQNLIDTLNKGAYVDVTTSDYTLADPEDPPQTQPEPKMPLGSADDNTEPQNFTEALQEFFGEPGSVPQMEELDTTFEEPEKESIPDLINDFISNNPLISVITGSGVTASSGSCSTSGVMIYGKEFKVDFCRWANGFETLGNVYIVFMSFASVLYIFRKE